jgi:hypothetical protein
MDGWSVIQNYRKSEEEIVETENFPVTDRQKQLVE